MHMAIATAGAPDLAAIKQRQQATWASGDYHMIGTQILLVAEQLIESLDVHSTDRVLDVATGSGNAALAAARRSCEVVGIDYVPSLLDRARERAIAEGVQAQFEDGDAEAIPFENDSFDVVASVFGSMFAPNQEAAAAELARVARSGGKIGLVAHTPEGYIGNLFKVIGKHVPPPTGLRSPILWGTEERLRDLFGDAIAELRLEKRHMTFRYRSPQTWVDYWRRYYGPTLKAFEAVGEEGRAALEADLLENIARFNRADDGTMVVPSEYLEAVIVVR
jgi:SAM-dependent methyltransferase